ncbi:hypothetical protein C2S53_008542 [Perilla frutescens var. hirtella]|uniref:Uncharacterized protein n=1 Tax=Perilla frutescens var. hirtella TaxID=608512 RepID=A0AAD4PF60_PERFH|nr:hypothetical protein C2S53_008542 [Perilla frutescens var. hirtella]
MVLSPESSRLGSSLLYDQHYFEWEASKYWWGRHGIHLGFWRRGGPVLMVGEAVNATDYYYAEKVRNEAIVCCYCVIMLVKFQATTHTHR